MFAFGIYCCIFLCCGKYTSLFRGGGGGGGEVGGSVSEIVKTKKVIFKVTSYRQPDCVIIRNNYYY